MNNSNKQTKGTLIIVSGSSGVGKGPIINCLSLYYKSIGIKFRKHVLYNSRAPRPGEENGVTYHFWDDNGKKWDKVRQDIEAKNNPKCKTFSVHADQQMINIETLETELETYDIVLLEISVFEAQSISDFCKSFNIKVSQIFISPLSADDFQLIGGNFEDPKDREIALRAVMLMKLANRGTESKNKQIKRSLKAPEELQKAIENDATQFCNPFSEDNTRLWTLLQEFVKESGSIEIVKMFINFLEIIDNGTDR